MLSIFYYRSSIVERMDSQSLVDNDVSLRRLAIANCRAHLSELVVKDGARERRGGESSVLWKTCLALLAMIPL